MKSIATKSLHEELRRSVRVNRIAHKELAHAMGISITHVRHILEYNSRWATYDSTIRMLNALVPLLEERRRTCVESIYRIKELT